MEDNLEPTNGADDMDGELDGELQNEPVNELDAELDDERKTAIAEHLDDIFDDERDDLEGGLPDDAAAVDAPSAGDGAIVASAGGSGVNGTNGANGYDGISGGGNVRPVLIEQEMRAAYLDYAMSVIVARALPDAARRPQARAPPHPLRHARYGPEPRHAVQEERPYRRRSAG